MENHLSPTDLESLGSLRPAETVQTAHVPMAQVGGAKDIKQGSWRERPGHRSRLLGVSVRISPEGWAGGIWAAVPGWGQAAWAGAALVRGT